MSNSFAHPERFALWLDATRRKRAGVPIDWRPLFDGYRATVDWPGAFFWRELVAAHPAAKVILTVRDLECWYSSAATTIYAASQSRTANPAARLFYGMMGSLDPRATDGFRTVQETVWAGTFGGQFADRDRALQIFAEHNTEVQRTVAPERLLVFDVRQGWSPLCTFLDVPEPVGVPFPHVNDAADFERRQREQYTYFARSILPVAVAALAGGVAGLLVASALHGRELGGSQYN
jgi:hypothetical protein